MDDVIDRLMIQRNADILAAVRRYAIETHEQYALNLLAMISTWSADKASTATILQDLSKYADILEAQAKTWRRDAT